MPEILVGSFGEPRPQNPSDTFAEDFLAQYAARAERRTLHAGNMLLVTIRVDDPTDGSHFESQSIGDPDLIRDIAALLARHSVGRARNG